MSRFGEIYREWFVSFTHLSTCRGSSDNRVPSSTYKGKVRKVGLVSPVEAASQNIVREAVHVVGFLILKDLVDCPDARSYHLHAQFLDLQEAAQRWGMSGKKHEDGRNRRTKDFWEPSC